MRNILVIGNGYDLAHGLKTSYENFLDFIKGRQYEEFSDSTETLNEIKAEMSRLASKNAFIQYLLSYKETLNAWVDVENELRRVTYAIKEFFDDCPGNLGQNSFLIGESVTEYQVLVLEQMKFIFRCVSDGRDKLQVQPMYYSSQYGVQWDKIKLRLRKELDGLKRALVIYLTYYMPVISKPEALLLKQLLEIHPDYVITFNYTDTYTRYAISHDETNVLHVHGELDSGKIVLGFDDDDEADLKLIEFKKYFQRIQYQLKRVNKDIFFITNELDWRAEKGEVISHFYGMSLDKTDEDVIKEIYENSDRVIVYYLVGDDGNQSDYEKKVVNLIDILGKKDFLDALDSGKILFKRIEADAVSK